MKSLNIFLVIIISILLQLNCAASQPSGDGFKLPAYQKFTLDNGFTIYLLEQHEVPLIYLSAIIPGGAIKDGSNNGLALLTAESLLYGTENYSKEDIETAFDYAGAEIVAEADLEYSTLKSSFIKDDIDKLLPIYMETLVKPVFPKDEVIKRQQRLLAEIEQAKESPRSVMGFYFNKFIYGENYYGNPVIGTTASVKKIAADEVVQFYKNNYNPTSCALAVAGDFNSADMKERLTKLFSAWKGSNANQQVTDEVLEFNALDESKVLLVNKDDSFETTFYIGGYGITRNNPDRVEIGIVNTILGGRFTSWLNDELRVNSGLTYGARSSFNQYRRTGTFVIASFTKTETTMEAIDLALEVLNRLHTKGIDEATLSSAKNYVKGQFPPDYETSGALADLLTKMFFYSFDESYINTFEAKVNAVTVEKANELIQKYFPKDNLQFVLIGKASELRDKVSKYGKVIEKDINMDGF